MGVPAQNLQNRAEDYFFFAGAAVPMPAVATGFTFSFFGFFASLLERI
jgi:hypothetical protein